MINLRQSPCLELYKTAADARKVCAARTSNIVCFHLRWTKRQYIVYIYLYRLVNYMVLWFARIIRSPDPRMMGICARNCLVDDFLLVGQALINNRRAILWRGWWDRTMSQYIYIAVGICFIDESGADSIACDMPHTHDITWAIFVTAMTCLI